MHGDDFTALGWESQLDWYREKGTGRFESKVKGRIGPASGNEKSMRVLNRLVHWTSEGIEYEADQRHAELIIQGLSLKADSKSVNTLGESSARQDVTEDDDEELDGAERTWYRGIVARGNYLAQDRCDIQYAVKELFGECSVQRKACPSTEEDGKIPDWEDQARGSVSKTKGRR